MIIKNKEGILKFNQYLELCEEDLNVLGAVAEEVAQSPRLTRLAEDLYDRIFNKRLVFQEVSGMVAGVENNAFNGLLWALVYVSGMDSLIAFYEHNQIDLQIMADTVKDLTLWMRNHKTRYGYCGLATYPWNWNAFTGNIFRLGRLQFIPNVYEENNYVFRNKKTGELVVLSGGGAKFRSDGYANGSGDLSEEHPSTSLFRRNLFVTVGNEVDYNGRIGKLLYLDNKEYECVFKKTDPILEIHVPQGPKIDPAECEKSLNWAKTFFKEHFDYDFKAFTCWSWLLDPSVGNLAGENSNINQFGKRFRKTPNASGRGDWKFFAFEKNFSSLEDAPIKTAFQQRLINEAKNGHVFRAVSGFILR